MKKDLDHVKLIKVFGVACVVWGLCHVRDAFAFTRAVSPQFHAALFKGGQHAAFLEFGDKAEVFGAVNAIFGESQDRLGHEKTGFNHFINGSLAIVTGSVALQATLHEFLDTFVNQGNGLHNL